ncbi:Fe-S cluster assembly scaffold protein NifU [Elusimicrobiota bacterium]
MALYSDKVMDHFQNPRNVGEIADADGTGEVGNPVCGDMMTFQIKVKDGKLTDVKYKTFGCGAAIAVSSMVSEMAIGKTLDEALKITNANVAEELGGLPPNKLHCSNLGADALHRAIEDYKKKQGGAKTAEGCCKCPYCETKLETNDTQAQLCKPCNKTFVRCKKCGKLLADKTEKCPKCG